jgi:hypothetical protein
VRNTDNRDLSEKEKNDKSGVKKRVRDQFPYSFFLSLQQLYKVTAGVIQNSCYAIYLSDQL